MTARKARAKAEAKARATTTADAGAFPFAALEGQDDDEKLVAARAKTMVEQVQERQQWRG
jgi:hypothetical protein